MKQAKASTFNARYKLSNTRVRLPWRRAQPVQQYILSLVGKIESGQPQNHNREYAGNEKMVLRSLFTDDSSFRYDPRYIFGIYDFDESGVLSVDETILALRSTISGMCKLCGLDPPLESELEKIALMVSDQHRCQGPE